MTKLLNGKKVAEKIYENLKKEGRKLETAPTLVVVLVGNNPASLSYVGIKEKAARKIGIGFQRVDFSPSTSLRVNEQEILNKIIELNANPEISGIIVQLPLPKDLNQNKILNAILPEKDVDGLTIENLGQLFRGEDGLRPATPLGIIRLLSAYKIKIAGKNVVIVGRSNLVGKPLAHLFLEKDATVTVCHSKTKDLKSHTLTADILVSAAGKPDLIKENMIKKGAVVVDVGTTKVGKKIVGDVDFEKVKKVASYITPVPGGIGPMTVAMLLSNVVKVGKSSSA